jgi:hypothetical protein
MKRRQFLFLSALASGMSAVNPARAFDFSALGKVISAGKDIVTAETLDDAELKAYYDQLSAQQD